MNAVQNFKGKFKMATDKGRCECYKDREEKYRWRAIAHNGRTVAAFHQGYVNKSDCLKNARSQGYNNC
jgi:uncharacterized protein YegP (UPF0339 family)